jgi:acyl-CoA thioesterase
MADRARAQRIAEAVGRGMYSRDHAAQMLGIRLAEIAPGRARMVMEVRPDMVNGHDICHGGLTFTLADTAFAYACNSYNHPAVAASCNIVFTAPARRGDTLTAVAEEKSVAGRSGVYDIEVSDQNGRTVALFRGHSRRLDGKVVEHEEKA